MYLLGIFVVCTVILLATLKNNSKSKYISWLCCAILIFLAFTFPIGRDINGYLATFERASSLADSFKYHMSRNFGFNAYMLLIKLFTDNSIIFRLMVNLTGIGLIGYTIYKYSDNKLFSTIIFFASGIYVIYLGSGIRQFLAMAIFFFSYFNFYLQEKNKLYYIGAIIATLFHEAGVFCLLLPVVDYLFKLIKNQKKYYFILLVSSLVLGIVVNLVMPQLYELVGADDPLTHVLLYFRTKEFSIIGLSLRLVLTVFYCCLFFFNQNKNETDQKMFNTVLVSGLIYCVFANFSIVSRVCDLICIIEIIYVPNMIAKFDNNRLKYLFTFAYIAILSVLLVVDLIETTKALKIDVSSIITYPYVFALDFEKILQLCNYI